MAVPTEVYLVVSLGLEHLLEQECRDLGLEVVASEPGGVTVSGPDALYRSNLESRIASKTLLRLGRFEARFFGDLERRARTLPWHRFIAPGHGVDFRVTAKKSRLYHQGAIADRLRSVVGDRVAIAPEGAVAAPAQQFVVRLFRDRCTISIDASGHRLHRRGYREATAKAPLRETLAAAMLRASGWSGHTVLIDPFAGSGTIPIEAALLARNIAPGLHRSFAFEQWPDFDAKAWHRLRDAARGRILPNTPAAILGYDRDAGAIATARANAERAGVAADVDIAERALSRVQSVEGPAAIVTNPPYGARLGDRRSLRNLYARVGTILRERFPAARATLLVADPAHEAALGATTELVFRTTNGGIPVRCVDLPATDSADLTLPERLIGG